MTGVRRGPHRLRRSPQPSCRGRSVCAKPCTVPTPHDRGIFRWLIALWLGVGLMLVVGGITRLTGSGLSITEWKPVTGAIPPLSAAAWADEFARYLGSPQGRLVNSGMDLAGFQRIYFWEWFHRLVGRSLGLLVALPWAWFALRGRLRGRTMWAVLGVFLLGAAQGLMGWVMVASGLVDRPHVDPFRLAAHLLLALLLTLAILRLALTQLPRPGGGHRGLHRVGAALVVGVFAQCGLGALVAGTRAGLIYPTFPGYGGGCPPPEAIALSPLWRNLVENPATMHVVHRTAAWLVTAGVVGWVAAAWRLGHRRWAALAAGLVGAQVALGVATVLLRVPIPVAAAHQACAWLLLSTLAAATWAIHPGVAPCPTDSRPSSSPSGSRASSPSASPAGRSARSGSPRPAGTSSRFTPTTS
jgi:cytochrome c oxidase assembly protein subunit 15